ncbi:hypothetical protein DPMN_113306 [Dreissena polymorpha]|uniref:Uncharacterized protein n=1 Tax=Dreissena polymorpha TaxID=45954 RepID=A0A9D4KI22_DREPO|nr:hypothetical protein DPMN_113306 [Dreissena polymorpha]
MATSMLHDKQQNKGDRPLESLIYSVEDVLAQVGPARKQIAEYRTFISEVVKQNEISRKYIKT